MKRQTKTFLFYLENKAEIERGGRMTQCLGCGELSIIRHNSQILTVFKKSGEYYESIKIDIPAKHCPNCITQNTRGII